MYVGPLSPFLYPPPCRQISRKKGGSSWLLKLFVWEQRRRPRSIFWIRSVTKRVKERERQTQRDTMKPSAPQKLLQRRWVKQKTAQRDKQVMKAWRIFEKRWHISFICRANACLSKQRTTQCWGASHFSLLSSCNCTGNHMAHKSCGHFFISTMHAPLPYAFKRETICFSRGPWKRALMPSKKKKKREQAHFIEVAPLWKIKPMCIRDEGDAVSYQSPGMTLRFVGGVVHQWGRNPTAPSLKQRCSYQ